MSDWLDLRLAVNLFSFGTEYGIVLYLFGQLETRSGWRRWLGLFSLAVVVVLYLPMQPGTAFAGAEDYSTTNLLVQGFRLTLYWAAVSGYLWLSKTAQPSVCLYLAGFYTSFYIAGRGLSAMGSYLCQTIPALAAHEIFHRIWMTVAVLALEFFAAVLVRRLVHPAQICAVGRTRAGLIIMTNFLVLYFKYSVITLQSAEGYAIRLGDMLFYPLCAMGSVLAFLILFESFMASQERQKAMEVDRLARQFELRYAKRSAQAQTDIKRIHHDMKNHLLAIRNLDQHKDVSAYVNTLLNDLADYDACVTTGLPDLDAFLSEKLSQAKLEQIEFTVCLDLKDLVFIAYVDLISIFGNAIDNALEAVRKLPQETERTILLKSSRFANAVILRVGNPYTGELRREGKHLLTRKADTQSHGIGLKSIANAVERYHGSVDVQIDEKEKWFELTILISLQ